MGFIVFRFLVRPRGLPKSSLHGASPFEGFPSPAASALAGFLPPHRSPSKDGAISGPCSAGRVRCVLCVLPREGARSSLGFLLVHRRVASPSHGGRRPEGPRSRGRGHLRSGSARSQEAAEAGSRAGSVPPRGPTVQRTAFRGAFCVGRLRPHAGRRGPGVTCSRGAISPRPSRGGV
jgi:hypothetical protein